MTQVNFHQFDAEYGSAYHTLAAARGLLKPGLGYVCHFSCGSGAWLAAAQALDARKIMGIDAEPPPEAPRCIPASLIAPYDLSKVRVSLPESADLAISILYLQQLPEERAENFVEDLCKSGASVLFGALSPFQISDRSAHLRWPSYWARLFASFGYFPDPRFRPLIWSNRFIDPSVRQNVLLYVRRAKGYRPAQPFENLDVVHPSLFEQFMTRQNWFAKQLTKSTIGKILGASKQ
jgi:hypothetical protein